MKLKQSVLAFGLLAFLGSCTASRFEIFKVGQPWQFLTPAEGDLNPDAGKQAAGYIFDVPVEGEIYATVNLQNPGAIYNLVLLKEGVGQPIANSPGRAGQPTRIQGRTTPGRFGIAIVAQQGASRFTLDTTFKPNDPVAKSKFPNTMQAGPIILGTAVAGKVSWPSQEQSHFYKITAPADGIIKTQITAKAGKPSVELVNAAGVGEALAVPMGSKEVKAGDWFVRVFANDITDFADYQLLVTFESADCDVNSGDDADQEGAKSIAMPGAAKDSVEWNKGDCTDWFKFELKDKGKVGIWCRAKTRGAKVYCELVKPGEEEGVRSTGSTWNADVDAGQYYIKVYAPDKGEGSPYDLTTTFVAAMIIAADVLEVEGSQSQPKNLIIGKGRKDGLVSGLMGTIMCQDKPAGSILVDQVYPDVSKVKVLSLDGKFDPGCKVVIGGK